MAPAIAAVVVAGLALVGFRMWLMATYPEKPADPVLMALKTAQDAVAAAMAEEGRLRRELQTRVSVLEMALQMRPGRGPKAEG